MSSTIPLQRTEKRTTMKKCLLFLAVLSLAFTAGSAIKCYICEGDDCRSNETNCPTGYPYCAKIDIDNGDTVVRSCGAVTGLPAFFQDKEFKGIQEKLDARKYNDVIMAYCNGEDLCNGTVRLAEISTMMILLPASLVLLISFFSRL